MKKGFTLVELVITMAIIGILAAIAYPGYSAYVVRARRSDAQAALLDLASRMERYYSQRNTYATATIGTGAATDLTTSTQSSEGWYTLSIPVKTASTYTLQASPNGSQAKADTTCQSLTLTNLGVKGIANGTGGTPSGPVTRCW